MSVALKAVGRWQVKLTASLCVCAVGMSLAAGARANSKFQRLAEQASAQPQNLSIGNELRRACREQKLLEQCVDFFDALVKKHPLAAAARYNAALAYIDNLPGHSLLAQARLSTKSMEHATAVLERSPSDWLAFYIRGLNNLYWPMWYRKTDRAIADLTRCIKISEATPAASRKPYMALAHVALGDAYVKLDRFKEAREVWERGAAAHHLPQLAQRLQVKPDALAQTIDEIRSREVPVDTDITFYAPDAGRT